MKVEPQPAGSAEPPPEVLRILESYVEELERGGRPNADALLENHPELAEHLKGCLASLEFLYQAEPTGLAESPNSEFTFHAPDRVEGRLGDFRILRQVGRGGMGVVYEAQQISLRRRVALKVLPFAGSMDPKILQRFQNEAQAAAGLHHNNIVPVYAVGCERGVHYYAMQFIEGQTLAAQIQGLRQQKNDLPDTKPGTAGAVQAPDDADFFLGPAEEAEANRRIGPLTPPPLCISPQPGGQIQSRGVERVKGLPATTQVLLDTGASGITGVAATIWSTKSPAFFRHAAELGRQAASGLEYAHARGVIHRDIKPANLLIDGYGNLWIADFGLARLPSELSLTLSGDFLGTLPYMSPEQALGEHALVDQRTDVYSLGMTLYELLTLQVAFGGKSREELLRQIAFDEPRPLHKLNAAVPSDLETIVLKAIAKCPEERYATAQEFADDLNRFLEDKPIHARRPTPWQRLKKMARRHRGVVWSIASSVAVAMILSLFALGFHIAQISAQNDQIKAALENETEQRRRAEATANLAYEALDEIVKDGGNAFLGSVKERDEKQLLRNALRLYRKVAEKNDNISRIKLGQTQLWVGYMQRKLGEKHEEVEATLRGSIRCFEELIADAPADPNYADLLAQGYSELGLALGDMGRSEEGLRALNKTIDLYQGLAKENPGYQAAAAGFLVNKGLLLQSLGRFKDAEAVYHQCLESEVTLIPGCPWSAVLVVNRAAARYNLALLMQATGRIQEAEKGLRHVLETLIWLRDQNPRPYPFHDRLAMAYHKLGLLLQSTGRTREAEESYRQALKIQELLTQQLPKVPDHRLDLSCSQQDLATLLQGQGKRKEADKYFRRCQIVLEALAAGFPHVSLYQSDLAKYYSNRGNSFREDKQVKEAEKYYRDAVRVYQKLIDDKDAPDFRAELANCHNNLGVLLEETRRPEEAETAYRRALDIFTRLPADFALMPEFQSNLGTVCHHLARVLVLKGDRSDACKLAKQAVSHHVKALRMNSSNPSYRRFFYEGLFVLGRICFDQAKNFELSLRDTEALEF